MKNEKRRKRRIFREKKEEEGRSEKRRKKEGKKDVCEACIHYKSIISKISMSFDRFFATNLS
jgi:hypothetical protein